MKNLNVLLVLLMNICFITITNAQIKPDILSYKPFVWESAAPADCPFVQSNEITGIRMLGIKSGFHYGDTWYPTWASNDNLYSPWTDGTTNGVYSWSSGFSNNGEVNNEGNPTRSIDDIKSLTIHHTGSEGDSMNYLNRTDYISAHYLVKKNGEVWQLMDNNRDA